MNHELCGQSGTVNLHFKQKEIAETIFRQLKNPLGIVENIDLRETEDGFFVITGSMTCLGWWQAKATKGRLRKMDPDNYCLKRKIEEMKIEGVVFQSNCVAEFVNR